MDNEVKCREKLLKFSSRLIKLVITTLILGILVEAVASIGWLIGYMGWM